jgi:hypothetical protein
MQWRTDIRTRSQTLPLHAFHTMYPRVRDSRTPMPKTDTCCRTTASRMHTGATNVPIGPEVRHAHAAHKKMLSVNPMVQRTHHGSLVRERGLQSCNTFHSNSIWDGDYMHINALASLPRRSLLLNTRATDISTKYTRHAQLWYKKLSYLQCIMSVCIAHAPHTHTHTYTHTHTHTHMIDATSRDKQAAVKTA